MWRLHIIKEAFFSTAIILLCCFFIYFLSNRFHLFDSFLAGSKGRNLYEFFYLEKNKDNKRRDTNIVLVQIEDTREKIARQIRLIEKGGPAVTGIDAVFTMRKDSAGDAELVSAIRSAKNVVFASRLQDKSANGIPEQDFFISSMSDYHSGYINLETDKYNVVKAYCPSRKINGTTYFSFTSAILTLYKPKVFKELERNANVSSGNINYFGNTKNYTALTAEELASYDAANQLLPVIKDKIVLLGYFEKEPPFVEDDIYFSPLNQKVGDNAKPDMYGVVIHANILSMILNNAYPKITSPLASFAVAFVVVFLLMAYIINAYAESAKVSYSKLIVTQLGLLFFVLYGLLQVYNLYSWQVPLLPVLAALILPVILLSVYRAVAVKLKRNLNYRTVFS